MAKDEEIHVHIIEEDYKSSKRKQEQQFETSGKADITAELMQTNSNAMEKLQKMHSNFLEGSDEEELSQEDTDFEKQLSSCSTAELFSSLQDMKNRENNLLEKKQSLLGKQQEYRAMLIHEISQKRRSIRKLETEVVESQDTCRQIEEALGIATGNE